MKLPKEMHEQGWHEEADDMDLIEAIVRDCAEFIARQKYVKFSAQDYYAEQLLARYGLKGD